MTYHALARKWRPRTFSQLVGQEPVVKVLSNSLNMNRLHHACLFTGTRGVGKTSVARLFAKAMNCEQGLSSEPCLECVSCVSIEQGCFIDLVEIDAASHTGVDHMRELLDNVQYAPASARYKVYIIDEVHMLSNQSFNALLKTLEEPPAHVKFLLATTDPQKLPKTVISRCLQFHLRHISAEIICKHLQYILTQEHITFEIDALDILAKAAQGSMRDALSLLDQAIAGSDMNISAFDVKQILGYTQQDYALQLIQAVHMHQPETIHTLVQAIADEGAHFLYVLEETLGYLHTIAVLQTVNQTKSALTSLAEELNPEDVQLFYQIALKGSEEIHLAPTLAIGFHMIFLRMLTFKPAPRIQHAQIHSIEISHKNSDSTTMSAESMNKQTKTFPESEPAPYYAAEILPPVDISKPVESLNKSVQIAEDNPMPVSDSQNISWSEIIKNLKLQGIALNALLQTELMEKNDGECILKVTEGHRSLFTTTVFNRVQQALSTWYGEKISVRFKIEELVQSSPARQQENLRQNNLAEAEQQLLSDPVFQKIQKDFSATLVENSVEYIKN